MDVREYTRVAWDREVERGNKWTVPVSEAVIAAARRGEWEILLTSSAWLRAEGSKAQFWLRLEQK